MEVGVQVAGLVVRARKPASPCVTADSRKVAASDDMHAERMVGEHHA